MPATGWRKATRQVAKMQLNKKKSFKPSSTGQLRLARYKPNGNPGSQVLYAEHTDYNSFTFLWRNRTNGLQAKLNGSWTPIPLLPDHPDALLVNLGDLMEVWTGGVWKSPRHQVLDLKTYFDIFLSWKKSLPLTRFFARTKDKESYFPLSGSQVSFLKKILFLIAS